MGVLEQIMYLKSQGMSEQNIIKELQEQEISPAEISNALNQAKIKGMMKNQNNFPEDEMHQSMMPETNYESEEIQPPKPEDSEQENFYIPKTENYPSQPMFQQPAQNFQMPYPQQNFQQEFYNPEEYAPSSNNTDTIIDVAEQVFAEKMSLISKQLDSLKELKTLTESRLNHIEERIQKVESIMDNLQLEILKRVSSYGENLQSIKSEMSMMQDSFGKVINPLSEKKSAPIRKNKPIKSKKSKKR